MLGELAELGPVLRQVAGDLLAGQVEGRVLDQAMGDDLAGPGRIHQGHVAGRQLDALAALAQLGATAALDDEEAVAVVFMVDGRALAADHPGVGADLRHLQPGKVLAGDLADEQSMIERGTGIETTTNTLKRTKPGIEVLRT
ncbi:hypothetical protein FQZ97_819980 [compost metagenome]